MKSLQNLLCLTVLIIVITSCAAGNTGKAAGDGTVYNELADYLRRQPGVNISGQSPNYTVRVRGDVSLSGNTEPLFVVDNVQVGNYAQAAAMVDPNNIRYVQVLKDVASTQSYGIRGSGGVILIRTGKKN